VCQFQVVCEGGGGLLDGSFIRTIGELIIDEDPCLERRGAFEASVVEFVGEARRHGGAGVGVGGIEGSACPHGTLIWFHPADGT